MSPDPLGNFVADATNPQTWNTGCSQAVDGGTGAAASAIANGGPVTIATIVAGDLGSGGLGATTAGRLGPFDSSLITVNTNPILGFFNGTIPGYTQGTARDIILLHELGHAAYFAGLPSAVVPDPLSDYPVGAALSIQNNQTVGDACFPQGDGGLNPGPMNGPMPVNAAKMRRLKKHF